MRENEIAKAITCKTNNYIDYIVFPLYCGVYRLLQQIIYRYIIKIIEYAESTYSVKRGSHQRGEFKKRTCSFCSSPTANLVGIERGKVIVGFCVFLLGGPDKGLIACYQVRWVKGNGDRSSVWMSCSQP